VRSDDTLQNPDVFSDNTVEERAPEFPNEESRTERVRQRYGCRTRIEIGSCDSRLLCETGRASYDSATRIQLEATLDLTRIDRQENSEGAPDPN
jgi:hypothetical protein